MATIGRAGRRRADGPLQFIAGSSVDAWLWCTLYYLIGFENPAARDSALD